MICKSNYEFNINQGIKKMLVKRIRPLLILGEISI